MSPAQKRKREKMGRYDPKLMEKLRDEIAAHPNPMFGRMIAEGRMSDSDVLDFSLSVASAYFSGDLLGPVKEAADANMELQRRRAVLVTAAIFGASATFDKDGMSITRIGNNPDLITAAVQALVDVGMTVAEAMRQLEPPPPAQCQMESDIRAELPALVN